MKTHLKRLLAAMLLTSTLAALTACGGTQASAEDTANAAGTTDTATPAATDSSAGSAIQRIQKSGTLIVGTASGYAPYEFIDLNSPTQEVIGIDMAMANKIAEKLGVKLQVQDMTFTALLGALTTNQIDVAIAGMSPTEERKKTIDFTDVYLKAEQRILVRKEDVDKYKDLSSFSGAKVAVQKGTTQEKLATELLPGAEVNSLEKVPVCVLELASKKADAVVIESTVAQQYIMANPDLALCDASFPEERKYKDTAIGVAKGNEDLIAEINEVIKESSDEGLVDQWIEEYSKIAVENSKAS